MKFNAVLFDHDGTLVDSEAIHMQLWREVMAPYGVMISDEDYWEKMLGVPMEQSAAELIERYRLDTSVENISAAKNSANREFLSSNCFPQIAGASDTLNSLAQRTRLALVSGSQRDCVEASIRGHGWSSIFEQVVSGDDVERNKPHPDSYLKALDLMGQSAENSVAVEDTETGIIAARAAGLEVIAIRSPLSDSHDFSAATAVVDSLNEAHQWLLARLA
ncbi:HAD family hydrolase [Marinobacterium lutimaris]|uniref:Haloacid dehalogenase superfamily, subfamily IA, variant 3 with third motif having DD or ED n=1 Tax=Marinobacterium lutimaris TaxID=568106 RepID=A0A1H5XJG3_9GAMM|nr:HAD family phosphatase [Marinobacterium lutimaris]SEG11773.1 haloacid dehalogenase superfamily, subfamily IA, variant 3 with third motif having DD or ED [Marinobacterium lutimaris]